MEINKTELDGVFIIKPSVFRDDRGYFLETYREDKYNIIHHKFVQHNISKSKKNVIRGLHYQVGRYAQGKLCQVLFGSALDITVDVRIGSPTYGKYYPVILSEENNLQLWIPPGFAHGFAALSDEVVFNYKCTEYYNRDYERSIRYNDPELDIDWMIKNPIVSDKDLNAPLFKDIGKDFYFEEASLKGK